MVANPVSASIALLLATLAAAPHKLAVPEWSTVNISPELASFYAGEVARVLRTQGFEVISARDIATLLGLERQKQLLGCGENVGSCMAELGAALGCDAIVTANLARLDSTFQGSLRLVSSRDGATLADEPVRASGERALAEALEEAAVKLAQKLRPPAAGSGGARRFSWIPLVAGAALGAGAGVAFGFSGANYAKIPGTDEPTAVALARDGKALQVSGWALAGVGAAALVGAGVLFLAGGDAPPLTPQVSVTGAGAAIGLSGVFP